MDKELFNRIIQWVIGVGLVLILSGCIVMRGNELPQKTSAAATRVEKSIPILFAFEWIPQEPLQEDAFDDPGRIGTIREQTELAGRVVRSSDLFEVVARRGAESAEYSLQYSVRKHDRSALAAFAQFLSDMTLTLVPGVETTRWSLAAELFDQEGASVWRREYTDSYKVFTWMPLFPLLFLSDNNPEDVETEVLRNLYAQPIHDLARSGLFEKKRLSPIRQIRGS